MIGPHQRVLLARLIAKFMPIFDIIFLRLCVQHFLRKTEILCKMLILRNNNYPNTNCHKSDADLLVYTECINKRDARTHARGNVSPHLSSQKPHPARAEGPLHF